MDECVDEIDEDRLPNAAALMHPAGESNLESWNLADIDPDMVGKLGPSMTASQEGGQNSVKADAPPRSNTNPPPASAGGGGGGAASGGGGSGGGKRKPPPSASNSGEEGGKDEDEPREKKKKTGEDKEAAKSMPSGDTAAREKQLSKMKVADLKELLRQNALKLSGKKAELVQRILKFEASGLATPASSEAEAPDAGGGAADAVQEGKEEGEEKSTQDSGASQQGMLTDYNPAEEAGWAEGEAVPFVHLAATLDTISATRKRLEIQAILTNALRSVLLLSPPDLVPFVYITLSRVAPSYEGLELGVGDSVLLQAVALASGAEQKRIKEEYKKTGDLGLVAGARTGRQQTLLPVEPLTLRSVFHAMKTVAATSGKDAVKTRVGIISGLLVAATSSEAKWIVRALQGKLRVGLQEPTVIVALATAVVMNPPKATGQVVPEPEQRKEVCAAAAEALKAALAQLPCYDKVLAVLQEHPYTELARLCPLTPGVPVKAMLAHPSKGVEEVMERFGNRSITCEFKYDGERAQVHVLPDSTVKIFSRNSEDSTGKFPDLVEGMKAATAPHVESMVIDCEVVAWNASSDQLLPFQILSTRARKNVVAADIKVKVRVFAFDLLFLNGQPLLRKPLRERREMLRAAIRETETVTFVTSQDTNDPEVLQEFMQEAIGEGCEGLMVKSLEGEVAGYEPDKRSREWLKVKKDYIQGMADSLDLVLVAGWRGQGKRTGLYGAFLLASFNPAKGQFETVCRLGTGFSDAQLSNFSRDLAPLVLPSPSPDVVAPTGPDQPDVWFEPKLVFEVEAADLSLSPRHTAGLGLEHPSRGIALRFPRFLRVREDKTADSATQSQQVVDMYRRQASLSPTAQRPRGSASASEPDSE